MKPTATTGVATKPSPVKAANGNVTTTAATSSTVSSTVTSTQSSSPAKPESTAAKKESKPEKDEVKVAKVEAIKTEAKPVVSQAKAKAEPNSNLQETKAGVAKTPTKPVNEKPAKTPAPKVERKEPTTPASTPVAEKRSTPSTDSEPKTAEQRVKRNRLRTIPYQSPIPEIDLINKLTAIESNRSSPRNADDKLILFYK